MQLFGWSENCVPFRGARGTAATAAQLGTPLTHMFCHSCGTQLADGASFCKSCGAPQAPSEVPGLCRLLSGQHQPAQPSTAAVTNSMQPQSQQPVVTVSNRMQPQMPVVTVSNTAQPQMSNSMQGGYGMQQQGGFMMPNPCSITQQAAPAAAQQQQPQPGKPRSGKYSENVRGVIFGIIPICGATTSIYVNFHEDGRVTGWNKEPCEEHKTESFRGRWQPDGKVHLIRDCCTDEEMQFTGNEYKIKGCGPVLGLVTCGEGTLEMELTAAEIDEAATKLIEGLKMGEKEDNEEEVTMKKESDEEVTTKKEEEDEESAEDDDDCDPCCLCSLL